MTNSEIEALTQSGVAHCKAKEFDAAIADFTKIIGANPKIAAVWYNRGYAWYCKGNKTRTLADWEQAVALAPDNARYREALEKARGAAGNEKPAAAAGAPASGPAAKEILQKGQVAQGREAGPAQIKKNIQPQETKTAHNDWRKTYKTGDIGPSGGVILCDSDSIFGQIFEAAPAEYEFNASLEDVFSGKKTEKIKINGLTGWHPPYLQHITWMYENLYQKGLGNFKKDGEYWSAAKVTYKECTLQQCFLRISCPAGIVERGLRDPNAYHRYNDDETCNSVGYKMDFMNGQLYIECAKKGRNMGKPVKNRIRPVREVTEKDAEIAAANKGKNYNPYKAKKKTMIGVGIAAIILGIPLASIGGVGFIGIIVGIVLLIKGIKF